MELSDATDAAIGCCRMQQMQQMPLSDGADAASDGADAAIGWSGCSCRMQQMQLSDAVDAVGWSGCSCSYRVQDSLTWSTECAARGVWDAGWAGVGLGGGLKAAQVARRLAPDERL